MVRVAHYGAEVARRCLNPRKQVKVARKERKVASKVREVARKQVSGS
ncbi:hypothetical protein [Ureibacillus aquaedulcis]|uniref:Uncharacterized protein n=1 Tax=Ureibacillus aquaedulcis TaxID=3058421 RepID=A0ABT8GQD1_9BACL|nr:hypothetical protein [Ureibacillus sp. BA0131]MDN4493628.1 hypothetical protein [Ureibacillus sp. BA0131]